MKLTLHGYDAEAPEGRLAEAEVLGVLFPVYEQGHVVYDFHHEHDQDEGPYDEEQQPVAERVQKYVARTLGGLEKYAATGTFYDSFKYLGL